MFCGLYPTAMRAAPTISNTGTLKAYNNSFASTYNLNNIANTIGSSSDNFALACGGTSSGHGTGEAAVFNTADATLVADAEL